MKKRRVIPQIDLLELSGDCAPLFIDRVTLNAIIQLWGTALYPATFTLNGKEKEKLSTDFELSEYRRLRTAVLDDFERGRAMSCDIMSGLQGISAQLSVLADIRNALNALPKNCCGGGSGGAGGSGAQPSDPIAPPDGGYTEAQRSQLCAAINYAKDMTIAYLDRYVEPVLGVTLESIGSALLAAWATPPYSTTALETAAAIVAALTVMGAGALSPLLSDVISNVFDDLYCKVFGESGYQSGITGWVNEVCVKIVGEYAYIIGRIVQWIIGASGAMDILTNWEGAIVPAGYNASCPECMYEDGLVAYSQYNPCVVWGPGACGDNSRVWSDTCISNDPVTPEVLSLVVPTGQWYNVKVQYSAVSYYMVGGIRYELWINGSQVDSWETNQKNCTRERAYTHSAPITSAVLKIRPRRDNWTSEYKINNVVWY